MATTTDRQIDPCPAIGVQQLLALPQRGIAEERDPGYPFPLVTDRENMDQTRGQLAIGIGDQRPQSGVPAFEVLEHGRLRAGDVGEIDGGGPPLAGLQCDVDVQAATGVMVRDEAFATAEREEHSATDQRGARRMTGLGVTQMHLDDGDTGVDRCGLGDQFPARRPRAVGADQKIGRMATRPDRRRRPRCH
jgi:hypothetical protein